MDLEELDGGAEAVGHVHHREGDVLSKRVSERERKRDQKEKQREMQREKGKRG